MSWVCVTFEHRVLLSYTQILHTILLPGQLHAPHIFEKLFILEDSVHSLQLAIKLNDHRFPVLSTCIPACCPAFYDMLSDP